MRILLTSVRENRTPKNKEMQALVDLYIARAARYLACETAVVPTEQAFWTFVDRAAKSIPNTLLLDSRGESLSSEQLAAHFGRFQQTSTGLLVLAVGPADGWSAASLKRATGTLSLGPLTLPHELARVVAAEQIYRALTILAGHPYHSGH